MRKINVGLLGLGEVASGVYGILTRKKKYFSEDIGVDFNVQRIAVRSLSRKRKVKVPSSILTAHPEEVIRDPKIDVIVELVGGTKESYRFVRMALESGKHVVTANKALLAERGDELFKLACHKKRWILFEASVGGGIPVIKSLRQGLVANHIDSIYSIINGTSNYILTRMTEDKMDFKTALAEAQEKGYAEADPTLDVEGIDAAHKLALLARFGFGGSIPFSDIYSEGISGIRSEDISFAEEFGYRIKLLAIAKRAGNGALEARVQPTLLPKNHILANVNGSFNAVLIRGDETGDILLYGRGAGSRPTASAVMSDLVDIAKRGVDYLGEDAGDHMKAVYRKISVKSISSLLSRYYMRFQVLDKPGVLSKISQILGKNRISISDCVQRERNVGSVVPLIVLTHDAHESDVRKATKSIDGLGVVKQKTQVIRMEDSRT